MSEDAAMHSDEDDDLHSEFGEVGVSPGVDGWRLGFGVPL